MFFDFVVIPTGMFILISTLPTDLRAYCSIDNIAAGSMNGFWIDGGKDPIGMFSGNIVSMFFHYCFFYIHFMIISYVHQNMPFLVSIRPTAIFMRVSSYTKGITDQRLLRCS